MVAIETEAYLIPIVRSTQTILLTLKADPVASDGKLLQLRGPLLAPETHLGISHAPGHLPAVGGYTHPSPLAPTLGYSAASPKVL